MTVYRVYFRLPGERDQQIYADFTSLDSAATFACVSDAVIVLELPDGHRDDPSFATRVR
jgi:hypothetical protein